MNYLDGYFIGTPKKSFLRLGDTNSTASQLGIFDDKNAHNCVSNRSLGGQTLHAEILAEAGMQSDLSKVYLDTVDVVQKKR